MHYYRDFQEAEHIFSPATNSITHLSSLQDRSAARTLRVRGLDKCCIMYLTGENMFKGVHSMPKRCDFCFQAKESLVPILPKVDVLVCKACSYKLQSVIGFLEYHQIRLIYQGELEIPPKAPKQKKTSTD